MVSRTPSEVTVDDEIEPFNLSRFIKYIVLAIIILILLAVVFSQVMEFQRQE